MADTVPITAGSGTIISTEEVTTLNGVVVSAQHLQRVAAAVVTADGVAVDIPGSTADGLLVNLGANNDVTVSGTVTANAGTGPFPVSDNGGSLTVDNAALAVVSGGTETGALRVTIANNSTGVVSVDDNGGTLTVDGTVAVSAVSGVVDVTPAAPVATDYLPVRLTDGTNYYTASGGGGGGGTSLTDESTFTEATTAFTPIGGVFNDALVSDPTAGQGATCRITSDRALRVNLRNATGAEVTSLGISGSLPAGTNNIGDVDVLSVVPGVGAANLGKQRGNSGGAVDVGVALITLRQDTLSNDAQANDTYYIGKSDGFGRLHVNAQGSAGEGVASVNNPVQIGLKAYSADPAAVGSSTVIKPLATTLGKQVVLPYAIPASTWSYAPPTGGLVSTAGVTAKAAAGASIRNYITSAQVINSHQTVSTEVEIRDGAAGTVLWRGFAQAAGGGVSATFDPPLRGTANTLVEIAEVTATATNGVLVALQGFTAAE